MGEAKRRREMRAEAHGTPLPSPTYRAEAAPPHASFVKFEARLARHIFGALGLPPLRLDDEEDAAFLRHMRTSAGRAPKPPARTRVQLRRRAKQKAARLARRITRHA
jgi:hypothetical protein